MRGIIGVIITVTVLVGALVASDAMRIRKAKDIVDRVYLGLDAIPSESQSNVLAGAESELSKIGGGLWILPNGSVRTACSEIHGQLFSLGLTLQAITLFGTDATGLRLAEENRERYAQKIPDFKRRLEYIRRTL